MSGRKKLERGQLLGAEWVPRKEGTPAGDVSPQVSGLDASPVYFTSSLSVPKRKRAAWLPSPVQLRPGAWGMSHHCNEWGTGWWDVPPQASLSLLGFAHSRLKGKRG